MLELKSVSKAFGGLQVISGLDFHVDEREIVSVIGPERAGKTTLFNLVTGVYRPTRARSCSRASRSSASRRTRSRPGASRARSRRCGCS
jgi:ABC-type branched-subunit amino acid transport system ATPase component